LSNGVNELSARRPIGQGHWGRKYKNRFSHVGYLRQKWIDLRQTKIKMISGLFHTIVGYISPAKMLRF